MKIDTLSAQDFFSYTMAAKDISVISNTLLRIISRAQGAVYYIPRTAITGIAVTNQHIILNTTGGDYQLYADTEHETQMYVTMIHTFLSDKETCEAKQMRWDMPAPDAMMELK